jgi:hypothetical protein
MIVSAPSQPDGSADPGEIPAFVEALMDGADCGSGVIDVDVAADGRGDGG